MPLVQGSISELERQLIQERMQSRLFAARARGRKGARRVKATPAKMKQVIAMRQDPDINILEVCEAVGISRRTYFDTLMHRRSIAMNELPKIFDNDLLKQLTLETSPITIHRWISVL